MREAEKNDLTALHNILLEMMQDIDRVCRRHHLRYDLYCGTLLGAVRDGRMIPWDDDADLTMPIEDYRQFYRIAQTELGSQYVIQDLGNTPSHPWLWMRVFRRNTCYLRNDWRKLSVHHGIALDIYPMIGVAESETGYRIQKNVLNLSKALRHIDYWKTTGYPEARSQRQVGKVLALLPRFVRNRLSMMLLDMAAFSPSRKTWCCTLDGAEFVPKYISADWNKGTELKLNGTSFHAPAKYDIMLHIMYGDYMTPPPPEMRTGHGEAYGGVIIDTERDFTWHLLEEER